MSLSQGKLPSYKLFVLFFLISQHSKKSWGLKANPSIIIPWSITGSLDNRDSLPGILSCPNMNYENRSLLLRVGCSLLLLNCSIRSIQFIKIRRQRSSSNIITFQNACKHLKGGEGLTRRGKVLFTQIRNLMKIQKKVFEFTSTTLLKTFLSLLIYHFPNIIQLKMSLRQY